MATKTAEKKINKKTPPPVVVNPMEALGRESLVALLHRVLVRLGEPARVPEIVRELGDDTVTTALARVTMESLPRHFVAVDRRWDIAQRYLDSKRPHERILEELVASYGAAIPVTHVAGELAHVYGRPREHFDEVGPRLLRGPRYFPVSEGLAYGLRSWLLDISADTVEDVLFYNYLSEAAIAPFKQAAAEADWKTDPLGSASRILAAANGAPVDNRIVQFFAWRDLKDDFDGVALYNLLHIHSDLFFALPEHRWMPVDLFEPIRELWREQALAVADLAPEEPAAAVSSDAPAKPLDISDEDLEEIKKYFLDHEDAVRVSDLLTGALEIPAGSTTFAADKETLQSVLLSHKDVFEWVGTERFRRGDTLPPYIGQLPDSLTFPTLPRYETADGEILDQILADDAFEENLLDDILNPIVQDVNDQESVDKTRWPEGVSADSQSIELVLKAHHKEIGTFPLSQIPPGFLPTEPKIVELTFLDQEGVASTVFVDNSVNLIYGLFELYSTIAAESGAILHLERTEDADVYRLSHSNETSSQSFVSPARLEELAELKAETEHSAVSTYDVIRRILDHYRKGATLETLLTEVNLVRRTPRRLVASILSGYHAFHLRAGRWTFDSKREPEGFDRAKAASVIR